MLSIPTYDAPDAYTSESVTYSERIDHHADQVGKGAHRMGAMLSIPIYEAIDACANVPHQVHVAPHVSSKKSGNVQKMCRAVGAMLSVPIYEAAETCGSGPLRGH
jgi:hypothetical protein